MTHTTRTTLHSLDDIRRHFANRDRATYFISPSNFNLMDMHRWVAGWKNINLIDCFDGRHPDVLVVPDDHTRLFTSVEDVNHCLLLNPVAQDGFKARTVNPEVPDQALVLFFDEYLEEVCSQDLQLEIALPPNRLVREVDSKIVTTEIGNQAGVPSVPNVLAHVGSYAQLQGLARQAGLGERWVVQTAYGDSGKTTFFIACEADYLAVAEQIEAQEQVKVMRWIRCTGTAIEACATRWGTFVGPLLTEMIGLESLTPYPGGWCGNELYAEAFSSEVRGDVLQKTRAMGQALYQRGYRGYFELDYLIDQDTGEVYLGELNARITGITAMTNMSEFSQRNVPLFLFHLLEYDAGVELALDVAAYNQAQLQYGAQGVSSQLILKHTHATLQVITQAPVSGVYTLQDDGSLTLKLATVNRLQAIAANEAYVLRIQAPGEYAYKGGDLAILFLNQVVCTEPGQLNVQAQRWVGALKAAFGMRDLTQEERAGVELEHNPANVKSGRSQ